MKILPLTLLLLVTVFFGSINRVVAEMSADLVEQRARHLAQLTPQFTGPNCWNSSLIALGAIDHFRFVSQSEFNFYVRNHCRKLGKSEPLTKNTLIVVREFSFEEFIDEVVHSFVSISPSKAFSKDSREPEDKPHFDAFDKAFVFAKSKNFFREKPENFDGYWAQPFTCDFGVKLVVQEDIDEIMQIIHQVNIGKLQLTVEVYQDLVDRAGQVKGLKLKENFYSRILMGSVREQIRFYKKSL